MTAPQIRNTSMPDSDNKSKRILVVDDDPAIGDVLQEGLEASIPGCTVDLASDGEQAMEQIRKVMPNLMILDIRMPGKDGLQVLQEVRAVSSVPVIMLTVDDSHRDRALELGANDYVLKPFDVQTLLTTIDKLL